MATESFMKPSSIEYPIDAEIMVTPSDMASSKAANTSMSLQCNPQATYTAILADGAPPLALPIIIAILPTHKPYSQPWIFIKLLKQKRYYIIINITTLYWSMKYKMNFVLASKIFFILFGSLMFLFCSIINSCYNE